MTSVNIVAQQQSVKIPPKPKSFFEFLVNYQKPSRDSDEYAIWDLSCDFRDDLFPPTKDRELYDYLLHTQLPDWVLELAWHEYRKAVRG